MIGRGRPRCFLSLLQYLSLRSSEESRGGLTRCCCGGPSPSDEFQRLGNEIRQLLQHRVVTSGSSNSDNSSANSLTASAGSLGSLNRGLTFLNDVYLHINHIAVGLFL